jgi:Tol biopolymer transport system component
MIFQSDREGKWNLYEAKQVYGNWALQKSLDKVNSFRDSLSLIGGPSLSYDGNVLYFFASDKDSNTEDIFYSLREGEYWGAPNSIGPPINTTQYEGFPSISADGGSMFFTKKSKIRKVEEETCYEIYRTIKDREGNWTKPLALPPPINLGCERAPRIMSDGRTLIFSSIREGGKGNFDLYVTQLQDNL